MNGIVGINKYEYTWIDEVEYVLNTKIYRDRSKCLNNIMSEYLPSLDSEGVQNRTSQERSSWLHTTRWSIELISV